MMISSTLFLVQLTYACIVLELQSNLSIKWKIWQEILFQQSQAPIPSSVESKLLKWLNIYVIAKIKWKAISSKIKQVK